MSLVQSKTELLRVLGGPQPGQIGMANLIETIFGVIEAETGLLRLRVAVSSSEILALNSSPKQLVSAPGEGKMITPITVTSFFTAGAITYAGGADEIAITWGSAVYGTGMTLRFDADEDEVRVISPWGGSGPVNSQTVFENAGLYLWASASDPTLGNGTAFFDILYQVVDLP